MKSFLIFVLISSVVFSQSIHQTESEFYKINKKNIPRIKHPSAAINKVNNDTPELNRMVFGFLPWWEKVSGDYASIRYDLLSHLGVFSFETDSMGNLSIPPDSTWPWNTVFNNAIDNHVKLVMTITNFNTDAVHRLLSDIGVRSTLFNNIKNYLVTVGFSGVIIDFENVSAGDDRQFAYKNFVRLLREELDKYNPNWEIGAALPPIDSGQWDFAGIADYCNYIFVMCYNYYGRWSSTTGPSSPLTGGYNNITTAFIEDYKDVPPEKLIMGVPYYGNKWETSSGELYISVSPYDTSNQYNNWQSSPYYKDIIPDFYTVERIWDQSSQTPMMRWPINATTWLQVWYDDSSSIAKKYDLAIQKNLGGVGMWALGYDDGRSELWNLIQDKFTVKTNIANGIKEIPYEYRLEQNYPNPFNPSTVIRFQIPTVDELSPVETHVTLIVYDVLGREIATLVNEEKAPGNYEVKFNGHNLSGGIYFYTLHTGNFIQSKKMILLK